MPNRVFREGFVDSSRVNALDYDEECFYHRLILISDDAGRFDGREDRLRSSLFPLGYKEHTDPVRRGIRATLLNGLVMRYMVDGHPFTQITNVQKYGKTLRSKYPDRCGAFDFEYIQMDTAQGSKGFVSSSLQEYWEEAEVVEDSAWGYLSHPKGSVWGADGKPRIPTGTGTGTGTIDGDGPEARALSSDDVETKYPPYQTLVKCEHLRSLTLEQYLRCVQARSIDMDLSAAVEEVVRRAELEGSIGRPGTYVDKQFSYWEKDHASQIEQRRLKREKVEKEVHATAHLLIEMKDEQDRVERIQKEFVQLFGHVAFDQVMDEIGDSGFEVETGSDGIVKIIMDNTEA